MSSLSPLQLAERLKSKPAPRLLDVRQPDEHAFAALPGSTLVPLGELADRVDEIEDWKDEDVIVYCHHGVRSLHAIGLLRQLGFERLFNLTGGIDRWSAEVDQMTPRY